MLGGQAAAGHIVDNRCGTQAAAVSTVASTIPARANSASCSRDSGSEIARAPSTRRVGSRPEGDGLVRRAVHVAHDRVVALLLEHGQRTRDADDGEGRVMW